MSIGAVIILAIAAGAALWGAGMILRERRLARRLRLTQSQPPMMGEPDARA